MRSLENISLRQTECRETPWTLNTRIDKLFSKLLEKETIIETNIYTVLYENSLFLSRESVTIWLKDYNKTPLLSLWGRDHAAMNKKYYPSQEKPLRDGLRSDYQSWRNSVKTNTRITFLHKELGIPYGRFHEILIDFCRNSKNEVGKCRKANENGRLKKILRTSVMKRIWETEIEEK